MASLWAAVVCHERFGNSAKFVNMNANTMHKSSGFSIRHRGDDGALFSETKGVLTGTVLHRLYPGGSQDARRVDFGYDQYFAGCSHRYVYTEKSGVMDIISIADNHIRPLCVVDDTVFRVDPAYDDETALVMYRQRTNSNAFMVDVQSGRKYCNMDNIQARTSMPMYKNTWLLWDGSDLHIMDMRSNSKAFLMKHRGEMRISTYYESLNAFGIDRDGEPYTEPPFEYGLLDVRNLAKYALTTSTWDAYMYMSF